MEGDLAQPNILAWSPVFDLYISLVLYCSFVIDVHNVWRSSLKLFLYKSASCSN